MKKQFLKIIIISLLSITGAITFFLITDDYGSEKLTAYFSAFIFNGNFDNNEKPLSLINFNSLNETEKKAYIAIYSKIKKHPKYIKIPDISEEEFNNVFFAVKNDNPDILCFSESCDMITFFASTFIEMHYNNNASLCNSMTDKLITEAEKISLQISELNDFEKELFIHDYITENCNYVDNNNSSNAYGCLIEKEAVCSGYSRAAMILFAYSGIESALVTGTGITPSGDSIAHMWNIVILDNKPYHLDITWDDPLTDSDEHESHLFFNLTDDEIKSDHTDINTEFTCNTTEYNYFVYNSLCFDKYDQSALDAICSALEKNIAESDFYVEIKFSNEDAYNKAVSDLIDNNSLNSGIYKIINYLSEKFNDVIDFSHVNFSKDNSRNYIRIIFDSI